MLPTSFPIVLTLILILLTTTTHADPSECYSSSGSLVPSSHPCDPSAPASMCCSAGQICLSNGLCEVPLPGGIVTYARGSCTDSSWKAPECLRLCMTEGSGDGGVVYCATFNGSSSYCCDGGATPTCCGNSSNVFKLDTPALQTTINASSTSTSTASAAAETHHTISTSNSSLFRSSVSFVGVTTAPLLPTPASPSSTFQSLTLSSPAFQTTSPAPSHALSPTPTLLLIFIITTILLSLALLFLLLYIVLQRRHARKKITLLEQENKVLRWKAEKVEITIGEGGSWGEEDERRGTDLEVGIVDGGGIGVRVAVTRERGYSEEVVREREDLGAGVVRERGFQEDVVGIGGGLRGYEHVIEGKEEGRGERREHGLRGYGYVTDVGARWF